MWPVSARFRDAALGSHRAAVVVQVLDTVQFGPSPSGTEIAILDGDVQRAASSDLKATLAVTIPGDYWDLVQPYGAELHAARGIDFGDGTRELVPLGYFRIDEVDQPSAPYGPITISAVSRIAQMQQNRVLYPYQVPDGTTHRTIFERLVNGRPNAAAAPSTGGCGYGMYIDTAVPIIWTGYDPDAATVTGGQVVEDSTYDWLAKLAAARGAQLRFAATGELLVEPREPAAGAPAVYTVRGGATGTLIKASRKVSRKGVYNVVSARGSDPAAMTGYRLAFNADPTSPLYYRGRFGLAPRYYASPLLRTAAQADDASATVLARSTGLPAEQSVLVVPDPSLEPLDVVGVQVGTDLATHVIESAEVPLAGNSPVTVKTRTVNAASTETIETDSSPDPVVPTPTPDPNPTPPGGGGPTGGTQNAGDGTQAAIARGWGNVIDGDEFEYSGAPNPAKWGLYDGAGHDGNGRRSPGAYSVHDGMMTVHGENKVSGGAAFRRGEMGYRVEIRARVYNTGGGNDRYHPVLILWPDSDDWPGGAEYDFMECDEGTGKFGLFMHLPNHQPYRQDGYEESLDLENWHNYACEWNPSARTLRAWIDGRQVYDGSGRVAEAPGPMHLTVQLDDFGGNPRPCNFDLAWVRIYTRPNA